jgi:hypothetical protein
MMGVLGAAQYRLLGSVIVHHWVSSFAVAAAFFLVEQKIIIGFLREYFAITSVNLVKYELDKTERSAFRRTLSLESFQTQKRSTHAKDKHICASEVQPVEIPLQSVLERPEGVDRRNSFPTTLQCRLRWEL